jgi:hypothetical protein
VSSVLPPYKESRGLIFDDGMLKSAKDPKLPPSCRPISLRGTVGNLSEKILLAGALREVNESGLMHDEQFGFELRFGTTRSAWPTGGMAA